ncbi:MAG: C-GCAxxG-C-C family protein [Candidatus Thiodiazotropha sp. (ex Dulcina madagascariensis)]|nr:C-GCAxxG-C-C family protein [Candidatus Thiodiazotropha sp. (ex Dulcina madagascariensis)]MCU7926341.1 C-GCAxxG-C-C family protein [Candidatus Thiodiazotropha sp. (ex Dulcina madagascariensis)]
MQKRDNAVADFCDGHSCSQAVLAAYCEEHGLAREQAIRLATGFGGGMGRQGKTCGALTGAVMTLGLAKGPSTSLDSAAKEETYRLVAELTARFRAECGATDCKALLGCDLSRPDDDQQAQQNQLFKTRCPGYVAAAMDILEELLGK